MKINSPIFKHGEKIPSKYTCDGKGVNPPLEFSGIPKDAKTLVLIVDDPDVPSFVRKDRMYDHWVVYDIPPDILEILENTTPPGTVGVNTDAKLKYQGPCPPDREHRYFFKLYALDIALGLPPGATKKEVEKGMEGHILAQAELIGHYERVRPLA